LPSWGVTWAKQNLSLRDDVAKPFQEMELLC